jgi:TonB family protein
MTTSRADCARVEVLAGTIALGEASDAERDAYRHHLSGCERCLTLFAGEREIERVMRSVVQARDAERWEPEPRAIFRDRARSSNHAWRWTAALAASLAVGIFAGQRIVAQHQTSGGNGHTVAVVHHVLTLPTSGDERAIASLGTQTAPKRVERAESLAIAPRATADRGIAPVGGENAILPHPPAIAYEPGAQVTTAFDVQVDAGGRPTACAVTKSSGYRALDDAVCGAAMAARYLPRMVNGRATAGTYRDAFTFRSNGSH